MMIDAINATDATATTEESENLDAGQQTIETEDKKSTEDIVYQELGLDKDDPEKEPETEKPEGSLDDDEKVETEDEDKEADEPADDDIDPEGTLVTEAEGDDDLDADTSGMKPRTKARFEKLRENYKALNTEVEALRQQTGKIQQFDQIMTENGVRSEDIRALVEYKSLIKEGKPEDAINMIKGYVDAEAVTLGVKVPVNELPADLQQQVDDLDITPEAANEIARLRRQESVIAQRQQQEQQSQQSEAESVQRRQQEIQQLQQQEVLLMATTIDQFKADGKNDPDIQTKLRSLDEWIKSGEVLKNADIRQWNNELHKFWNKLNRKKEGSAPAPVMQTGRAKSAEKAPASTSDIVANILGVDVPDLN